MDQHLEKATILLSVINAMKMIIVTQESVGVTQIKNIRIVNKRSKHLSDQKITTLEYCNMKFLE